jgi:hypothetical protein
MSNTNRSEAFIAFQNQCRASASAITLGKDVMSPLALSYAALCFEDLSLEAVELQATTADLYANEIRLPAEMLAADTGKPLKPQTEKSRKSQVSKLAAYAKLGFRARENAAVLPVLKHAARRVGAGYTNLTAIAVALVAALVEDRNADEDTLYAVVEKNMPKEKAETTPDGFVGKMVASLEKAKDGTKTDVGILWTTLANDEAAYHRYTVALAALRDLHERLVEIAPPVEDPLA